MRKFGKASLFALAGMAIAATAAMASPAAATTYDYFNVANGNSHAVTVSTVTWSGSYSNQITGSVGVGATSSLGKLTTVFSSGTSFVDFKTDDGNGNVCYFTLNINNSTFAYTAGSAEQGTAGSCSVSSTSGTGPTVITFTTTGN